MNLANALIWKLLQLITSMRALTCLGTRSLMRLGLLANIYQLLQGITASRISGLHCCGSFFLWREARSRGTVFSQTIDHLIWLFFNSRYALFVSFLSTFRTMPFAAFPPLVFVWHSRNVLLLLTLVTMFHNLLWRGLSLEIWQYP